MERPKKKEINWLKDEGWLQAEQVGHNQGLEDMEKYYKWLIGTILCDMQECPSKEYHKKQLETN